MYNKKELNDVIKCCGARLNRGPASEWKHGDFNELSRQILRETSVNISPNTLKRIFGKIAVDDDYFPQQATVDALKTYGKYTPRELEPDSSTAEPDNSILKHTKPSLKTLIAVAVLTIVAVAVLTEMLVKSHQELSGSITLKSVEGVLPSTASFNLEAPDTDDSLFVGFGDKSSPIYVKPKQKRIAHIYLFPGVFNVTLQTRHKTVATIRMAVHSNKWIGLSFRRLHDLPERYYEFPAVRMEKDSFFHISNTQLFQMGLDTNGLFFTRLCNFTRLKGVSDNFVLHASFKNALPEKGIYCSAAQVNIAGIDGYIRFKLVSPGCSFRANNVVSEQSYDGAKTDLSKFVVDLTQWNTIKLINRNKHILLIVNNKPFFEGKYQKSLGEIQGMFLEFEGNGYVRSCNLQALDGRTLYRF